MGMGMGLGSGLRLRLSAGLKGSRKGVEGQGSRVKGSKGKELREQEK